jgi:hypothetical protein
MTPNALISTTSRMKLVTLTTALSLISLASCAQNVQEVPDKVTIRSGYMNNVVSNTPEKHHTYTNELERKGGKEKVRSAIKIGENDVATVNKINFDDPANNFRAESWSSVHVHNPNGIKLDDVGKIARNLEPEFVSTVVDEEKKIHQHNTAEK